VRISVLTNSHVIVFWNSSMSRALSFVEFFLMLYSRHARSQHWTDPEDEILRQLVAEHGAFNWPFIASLMVNREAKQCRERHEFIPVSVIAVGLSGVAAWHFLSFFLTSTRVGGSITSALTSRRAS
jgi:hypothetical protein